MPTHAATITNPQTENAALIQQRDALRMMLGGCLGYFDSLTKQDTQKETGKYWAPDATWLAPIRAALPDPETDVTR